MSPAGAVEVLVVGHGLAGALLAETLAGRGVALRVIDAGRTVSTSRTAAGLINPITGQRLVLNPDIGTLLPTATDTYRALESRLGLALLHEVPMLRLFRRPAEHEALARRRGDPAYAAYLGEECPPVGCAPELVDDLGGVEQRHTGYLDTVALLDALRSRRQLTGQWVEAEFRHADLALTPEGVRWCGLDARRVVFCEGYRLAANPWFNMLPLQAVKGEILSVAIDGPLIDHILNAGTWLVPRHDGGYRLGATYDREHLDELPTSAAREQLLGALGGLLRQVPGVRVLAHEAGVRPGTRDKLPFIGPHPQHPQLLVFNGFGSKGSLAIPWHAERLAEHMLNGQTLPAAADCRRALTDVA